MTGSGVIKGVVKFYDENKGYGFIKRDDGQPDVFVHAKQLKDTDLADLAADDVVEFEVEPNDRGPRAARVKVILGA